MLTMLLALGVTAKMYIIFGQMNAFRWCYYFYRVAICLVMCVLRYVENMLYDWIVCVLSSIFNIREEGKAAGNRREKGTERGGEGESARQK